LTAAFRLLSRIHPPLSAPAYALSPNTAVLALLSGESVGRSVALKLSGNLVVVTAEHVYDPWRVLQMLLVPPWGGKTTEFIISRLCPPAVLEKVHGAV
jgi:hypothetical protein